MLISRLSGWGYTGGEIMPPEYIGKSASMASSINAITVAIPAGYQENDLFLLLAQGYSGVPAEPKGWTTVTTVDATSRKGRLCYKFAASSESSVSVADSGNSTRGLIACFRGVSQDEPINSYSSYNKPAGGSSLNIPAPSTTKKNCMIVVCVFFRDGDADDSTNYSDWSNSSLLSITEGHDESTIAGLGGGIAFAYGVKKLSGATGNTTTTADSDNHESSVITVALSPQ